LVDDASLEVNATGRPGNDSRKLRPSAASCHICFIWCSTGVIC
jgi:hypothetical protein